MSTAVGDGIMALPGVIGTVCSDASDRLVGRDLAEQVGQDRCVTDVAPGDLNSPHLQGFLVYSEMDLAPDAPTWATVLARVPFAFALDLDARAVNQQMQRPLGAPIHDAEKLTRAAVQACTRAKTMVEGALQTPLKDGFQCDVEPSDYRREHRPGRAPKIDSDPVLQTFIEARIDKLTFAEVAADVAAHFPPKRRVGKSAIHAWWQRHHKGR